MGLVAKLKGIPKEQVAILLEQVKKKGIEQLSALKGVSNEVGIQILADMDTAGFAFQETTSQVSDLLDQLDKLKRGQEVNLKINVATGRVDPTSAKILAALGVRLRDVLPKNKSKEYVEDNVKGIDR